MFCLLTKYRSGGFIVGQGRGGAETFLISLSFAGISAAIDYGAGSMAEARASLETIRTFMEAAEAYMKGQLRCSPVQEAFLWER